MAKISRNEQRIKRHMRIRQKIRGTPERPRLCVFKSLKHIYAQIIDDTPPEGSRTLVSASTLDPEIRGKIKSDNVEAARLVGRSWPSGPSPRGSRRWCSTGAVIRTMGKCGPWRRRPGREGWNFDRASP
jgi:ribosomal protein L18